MCIADRAGAGDRGAVLKIKGSGVSIALNKIIAKGVGARQRNQSAEGQIDSPGNGQFGALAIAEKLDGPAVVKGFGMAILAHLENGAVFDRDKTNRLKNKSGSECFTSDGVKGGAPVNVER